VALPLKPGITGGFVMAGRFTHILVPTDFNPASDAALACAKELAARFDARLTLLHAVNDPTATGVWTPDVYVPATPEMQAKFLQTAKERLEATLTADERTRFGVTIEVRIGGAAEIIEQFAGEQRVDLIVMGTHGRRGLSHMLLGSVAERLVRNAPCPVLTTHAEPAKAASESAA
jgi:nucleotide-binding universal stress UspA family protein